MERGSCSVRDVWAEEEIGADGSKNGKEEIVMPTESAVRLPTQMPDSLQIQMTVVGLVLPRAAHPLRQP